MTQSNSNAGFSLFSVPAFLREYRTRQGTLHEDMASESAPMTEATNFGKLVVNALAAMTHTNGAIDQQMLCMYLSQAPSYLVLDTSMDTSGGVASWNIGFQRLVDVMVALHARDQLELDTVNAASKACSECWSIAGSWRGLDECREHVRQIAAKLKTLLDENGRTFKGNQVYAP